MSGGVIWISGPPAAGKSCLAAALVKSFERGMIVPVDDIREWVKSGGAGPVPWTDETERQYRLGEEAACDVAKRYSDAGFMVIIDACRSPKRVDELLAQFPDASTRRVLLLPHLDENFRRAHTRTNKDFDPHSLDGVISHTHKFYQENLPSRWQLLDNTLLTLDEEIEAILGLSGQSRPI